MKPTGNVTFLFTDIEGSTRLSQEFPEKLPAALERHNLILKEALESNNGFIFNIIGDSFYCAFENAIDAVKAAVEIQTGLRKENWDEALIRVRIGIHSGNAEWSGERYMGYITLARTARIMEAAYGEQILISSNTHSLSLEASKTQSIKESNNISLSLRDFEGEFRDLGERRLKDVIEPIRLFQIESEGLRKEFPPLKTLDARPNNLPIQLTSFIGREKEMKFVKDELKNNRLLTLTGTGGAGKTRFALQTAADVIDEFENGVWFVDLSALKDIALLSTTMMNAIGIKEESKKTSDETLVDYLKDKETLIILDNCEQLINACALLTEKLLSSCPKLKIISTSRESMNCSGEFTYRIPPLTHPDSNQNNTPEELTQYESVRLFIERALSVNPNFRVTNENAPALAEVCLKLDGIPLALELAAARTKVLSIEKIHERLDDRFNLLTGGKRTALPRQQTLRALIDWSYDLLSENEKILWSRLSVFNGGWTLEAAEEVCSDDTIDKNEILDLLSQLTEKSVIIYDHSKNRYRILESLKQYGIEKLSGGKEIFLQHLNYFLKLSEKAKPELIGENTKFWMHIIEADHNNFLSAIEWSVNNENKETGAVISNALGSFWSRMGQYSTGIRLIEIILESSGSLSKLLKGDILNWIGNFRISLGDNEQAKKYLEESLDLNKEIGDKRGIAESMLRLGNVTNSLGEFELAKNYYEDSQDNYKEIGSKSGIAATTLSLGNIALNQGDYGLAKKYNEESLSIFKEIGHKYGIAISINNLGDVSLFQGDYELAKKYLKESLQLLKEIGNKKGMAFSINTLGNIVLNQGDYELAKKYYEESLVIFKEIGHKHGIALSILSLGMVVFNQGYSEQAKKYYEESLDIRKEIGDKNGIAESIKNVGNVAYAQGDYQQANKYYKESLDIYKEIGSKNGIANSINSLGNIAFCKRDFGQANKYYKESLAIFTEIVDKIGITNSINNLGKTAYGLGDFEKAIKLISAAENVLESMGVVFDKYEQKIKDEIIEKLHEQLTEEEYAKYREEGKKLTMEEAVQLIIDN